MASYRDLAFVRKFWFIVIENAKKQTLWLSQINQLHGRRGPPNVVFTHDAAQAFAFTPQNRREADELLPQLKMQVRYADATIVELDCVGVTGRLPSEVLNDLSVAVPEHSDAYQVARDLLLDQGESEGLLCSNCGTRSIVTATRFGRRDDCPSCGWRSWDGKPLVSVETLALRKRCHRTFDAFWQRRVMTRAEAYNRLAEDLGVDIDECHFAHMEQPMLERAIAALESWVEEEP